MTALHEKGLTFEEVSEANRSRAERWHPGFPEDNTWTGADWSNAMCGEAGEAANVVKKMRRWETGHHGVNDPAPTNPSSAVRKAEHLLIAMLGDEIADVYLYLDLLATKYGLRVSECVIGKFNEVSIREGFPERLP